MILEVIALNIEDIEELNDTLIDRVEFCIDINEDGLTPNKELLEQVLSITKKPINVMIRNTNSFILQEEEEIQLLDYIKYLNNVKDSYPFLNGIVLGYYTQEGKLNENFLKEVNKVNKKLKITFHKAVDNLIENKEYLKLNNYNIATILTQGGKSKIQDNISKILKMKNELKEVEILLGGGINEDNINELIKLGCSIHLGSLARIDKSYNKGYNISYLNRIKKRMIGEYERLYN